MPANFSENLARNLGRMIESEGSKWAVGHVREALADGQLKPEDFSLKALAENLIPDGREFVRLLDPRNGGGFQEAADVVSSGHFANITGQIIYSKILEASTPEDFIFSKIIPTVPTSFSGEKIPGITGLGDAAQTVNEGEEYPLAGVNEDFVETPSTVKKGNRVAVTKEAIFFDRTGLVLARASAVGLSLGMNKEKRIIDCIIDETATAHRYKWRGNVIATFGDNSGTHSWDNLSASTTLLDHTSVASAELLLANMTDPNTGEPMSMYADTLICTPQNTPIAWRILNSISVDNAPLGWDVDSNASVTRSPSPLGRSQFSSQYKILSSRLLAARMTTDTSWYLGKPTAAYVYMENWPITVSQAAANSEAEFNRDIVAQFKASERGAAATLEPRYMVKCTA